MASLACGVRTAEERALQDTGRTRTRCRQPHTDRAGPAYLTAPRNPRVYSVDLADGSQGSTRGCPSSASATVSCGIAGCRHLATSGVLPLRLLQ